MKTVILDVTVEDLEHVYHHRVLEIAITQLTVAKDAAVLMESVYRVIP